MASRIPDRALRRLRDADGKQVLISIQSGREWAKLAERFLRRPELGTDERFATNVARVRNRAATDAVVAEAFAGFDEFEARDLLASIDIAFASVNDMASLATHPHLRRITVETPAGPVAVPAPASILMGVERDYGAVPAVGEHAALDGYEEVPCQASSRRLRNAPEAS